ncbi:hypothetical protein [Idiomarina sp. HP20-50]|uniref:hypothetical protein n=1 Tax=Idiomarina sp. HP20-50 TaxID=3070813 RepID=UPI00294AD3D6|nr:hypothetical protein [Idiomarina sp. HP20-50]MDV6314922.1 hypothetical protein [Idiomarina sp. HP20-50]
MNKKKGLMLLVLTWVIIGCSSTPDKQQITSHQSGSYSASPLQKLGMKPGVYQGFIRIGEEFRVVQLRESGQHAIYKMKLARGLTAAKRYTFTNDDMQCDAFQCAVRRQATSPDEPARLMFYIQRAMTGFQVVEVSLDNAGGIVLAAPFKINERYSGSAARAFLTFYGDMLRDAYQAGPEKLFGEDRSLWLGVKEGDYFSTLQSLDFKANGTVTWRRYADVASDNLKAFELSAEQVTKTEQGYRLTVDNLSGTTTVELLELRRGKLEGTITEHHADGSVFKVSKVEFLRVNPIPPRSR